MTKSSIKRNNSLPSLYLISDRTQTLSRPLTEVVRAALEGGVRLVQLREKDLSGRELFGLAKELRELTNRYGAKLLINDRVDIAMAVGANGVHLGRQSIGVQDAKRAFEISSLIPHPSSFIVGVSTHSLEEAMQAEADGADFITFGPVYHTPLKAAYGEPVGAERLREVVKAVKIPVFALGGIKKDNIGEALDTGAYGISVISDIMSAGDVMRAAEEILETISAH